jgi:hypothetical protein
MSLPAAALGSRLAASVAGAIDARGRADVQRRRPLRAGGDRTRDALQDGHPAVRPRVLTHANW